MDILTQDQLIDRIAAFCLRHGMTESRFGRDALNNPAFVSGLREGKSPTLETLNKVASFIEERDAAAATKAKLNAPPPEPRDEEEVALPFAQAPVSPTGECSPICSSTTARATTPPANGSCRCSEADGQAVAPSPSCSADAEGAGQ